MPCISERRRFHDETEEMIVAALVTSDDELLKLAMMYCAWAEESRYLNRSVVYTKADRTFFNVKYYTMSDDVFRQRFRVTRQAFRTIARMIEQHPIFHSNSSCSQLHPAWQLLVALTRLGHFGSRMAVELVADEMGMSSGAVTIYTNRVLRALVSLAPDWIQWPSYFQRQEHGLRMGAEGFPRCFGFIDGTTLPLCQKPALHGPAYYDRKKRYYSRNILCFFPTHRASLEDLIVS
ncbi:MAG: hypothetical protein JOS17DRAFT_13680 [Linnemannia elongata]|nr:MAG: hypothetical protein JOS17DRAFT_13680 [Linnemannia elongata]